MLNLPIRPGVVEKGPYLDGMCRYGQMRWLASDIGVGTSLNLYGEYSQSEVDLWDSLLDSGSTVVSAGANVGAHVIALARMCGWVFTAEPNPVMHPILAHNLGENQITNVTLFTGALGEKQGSTFFRRVAPEEPCNFGGLGVSSYGQIEVDVITIDELVRPMHKIHMIHLDVEGYELRALKGAQEVIARDHPILYVEADRLEQVTGMIEWIAARGYQTLLHNAPMFNPNNFAGNRNDVFAHNGKQMVSIMCLAMHPNRRR